MAKYYREPPHPWLNLNLRVWRRISPEHWEWCEAWDWRENGENARFYPYAPAEIPAESMPITPTQG